MRVERYFDFEQPDYVGVFNERIKRLRWLRAKKGRAEALESVYRNDPAQFLEDWGVMVDPRNISKDRPALVPFVLMPKQRELISAILAAWRNAEPLVIEKSRDVGASWLVMALSVTLCLFYENMMIGVGSSKEIKVDRSGHPDCLFYKARMFRSNLPIEFGGSWDAAKDSPYMRMLFRESDSSITGEAGEQIGMGGRKAIYFLDESANIGQPDLVDQSLAGTTDCRIDLSSVFGMANHFAQRRHSGKYKVFTYHWRDDPRKDDDWEAKKRANTDPVVFASQYDINYTASVEGVIIPQEWVQAAVDAHLKLKWDISGVRRGALDIADEGRDLNAFVTRHGYLIEDAESWSGQNSNPLLTAERSFMICERLKLEGFDYDADGMGGNFRVFVSQINARRAAQRVKRINVQPFRGSGPVYEPEKIVAGTDRKAIDYLQNAKAQSWWYLRERFRNTFSAVNGQAHEAGNFISISSACKERALLCVQLSQPQWTISASGKMVVDKTPDGAKSLNLADAVMIAFAKKRSGWIVSPEYKRLTKKPPGEDA